MKKGVVILTAGLILIGGVSTQAFTISDMAVIDSNVGNVGLIGTLAGVSGAGGLIVTKMEDSFGELMLYSQPDQIAY